MPSIYTNNFNGIDSRMVFESFQSIDEYRFIVYMNKLLGNIMSHSLS